MNFDLAAMRAIKSRLEEEGYVNDEQTSLGTQPFKHSIDKIRSDLAELGYDRELQSGGGYFENVGGLWWIYDPEMVSYEEASGISEQYAKK